MSFVLPTGWVTAPIADVILDVQTTDPSTNPDTEITYLDISSIDNEAGKVTDPKIVLGADAPSRARQIVESGDVLFSTVRPNLRAIAQVPDVAHGIASTGFCVLRSAPIVVPKYLCFFVRSEGFLDALLPLQRGVSYPAVRSGDVVSQLIPLAPISEQTRIVEKLEELLSDLDAGVAELKAAQKKLAQYRQSLLKAAVEGALTAEWRKHNPPQETGAQLLERILKERRARWEAKQLAKFEEQGKASPKGWQDKYVEPVKPDIANLPKLPELWTWASVEQLGTVQLGRQRSPKKMRGVSPIRYIRAANITEQGIDFDDVLEMDFTENEQASFQLQVGDVLLTEASGSPEHVGRPVIWPEVEGLFCFQNTVLRFRPEQGITSTFAFRLFQAWQKLGVFRKLSGGVGINHLSAGKFSKLAVPLPSEAEQCAIVNKLDAAFSMLVEQEATIIRSLKQSAAQRKNILKAAFSGQLVPQDPNDEPASVLLERIRAERASVVKTSGRKARHA